MARVFISHANVDKPIVNMIFVTLHRAGHEPWLDEDEIMVGESIPDAIERGLSEADYVVLCLSHASAKSAWTALERAAALMQHCQRGKSAHILPVRLDDVPVPTLLAHIAHVDLFPEDRLFDGLKKLVRSIGKYEQQRAIEIQSGAMAVPAQPQVIGFASVMPDKTEKHWRVEPFNIERCLFHSEAAGCKMFFYVPDLVEGADPTFDVTIVNRTPAPLVLTSIGVEIVQVKRVIVIAGVPTSVKIKQAAKYRVRIPELNPSALPVIVSTRLDDPIYMESQAPFRFSLHLSDYCRHIPNHALLRLCVETDAGTSSSDIIYMRQ